MYTISHSSSQRYVEQLSRVPKEALDAAGTKIVVIGCGEWNPIKSYAGIFSLPYKYPTLECYGPTPKKPPSSTVHFSPIQLVKYTML